MKPNNKEIADAQMQVDFIAYLQRLLVEGDFNATYKFALLHALADICIERPLNSDSDLFSEHLYQQDVITLDELAEKFIELYWQHSLPYTCSAKEVFSSKDSASFILLQNAGNQSAIINVLKVHRERGVSAVSALKSDPKVWRALCSHTRRIIKEGPLWRLQILAGSAECYYYPHDNHKKQITLNPGIAFCFRRFYDLVVSLARTHWTQKICNYPINHTVIGGQGNLSDFLFGSNRKSLIQARTVLYDIQKGRCFYCGKSISKAAMTKNEEDTAEQAMAPEVDHFIPRARYPNDLGHNFVLAHRKCNNAKRDHLAAEIYKERWFEQNIMQHSAEITNALQEYFTCDKQRSEAITTWAYQLAADNGSSFWPFDKTSEPFSPTSSDLAIED
ncbi:HNH endonuclease [Shewanella abyssi]|uniref:HNH endonuclease n=1 Tax=Shewanella abyssi TaxID=311789 RepID=UPI00200E9774|nr:HNH endonuclease domain-containing protein [Shewanella abyssi]MCL1052164.1 HNH endonuclease [Shewanella abyssi]